MWTYLHEERYLEEESNERLKNISGTIPLIESENEKSNVQVKNSSEYENILSNNFENEIEESSLNAHKVSNQHLNYAKSQEHWQQEELMAEIYLEMNDGKDCHCMKEEYFQEIFNESRILDMIGNGKIIEKVCKMETFHPIKDCLCIKEECAWGIENISKILELIWNDNKDEHVCSTHG